MNLKKIKLVELAVPVGEDAVHLEYNPAKYSSARQARSIKIGMLSKKLQDGTLTEEEADRLLADSVDLIQDVVVTWDVAWGDDPADVVSLKDKEAIAGVPSNVIGAVSLALYNDLGK